MAPTVAELNNDCLRVRVVPEIGGSIIECSFRHSGDWIPILRPGEDPLSRSSNASSFVVIPYSNRLRDGQFTFAGKQYQLRHADKHAIHGDVRDRPLTVVESRKDLIVMDFNADTVSDVNFPFAFSTRITYGLEGSGLVSRIELMNTGKEAMPAGCGFHPYFNRWLPGSTRDVELQFTVSGVYPGETPLPTGPPISISRDQDFHTRRPLDVILDHCFSGWDRHAVIDWPGSDVRAEIDADPSMEHVILYAPIGQDFFALEPVTNANDGFNLLAQGNQDCGVVILQPGEVLNAGFRIKIEC